MLLNKQPCLFPKLLVFVHDLPSIYNIRKVINTPQALHTSNCFSSSLWPPDLRGSSLNKVLLLGFSQILLDLSVSTMSRLYRHRKLTANSHPGVVARGSLP